MVKWCVCIAVLVPAVALTAEGCWGLLAGSARGDGWLIVRGVASLGLGLAMCALVHAWMRRER